MTEEEWRPVVGHEGVYEVSSWGRVRSLPRVVMRASRYGGGKVHPWRVRGRFLKLHEEPGQGYLSTHLWKENRSVMRRVHSLVAEAFIGPLPAGMHVRHLDGDPLNPHIDNLAHGTPLENAADMRRHGTHVNTKKTHCPSGHPYDGENTYISPDGDRLCRICRRSRQQQRAAA